MITARARRTSLLLLLAAFGSYQVPAVNWPQFRGPQASGVDDSAATPAPWNVERGENIQWRLLCLEKSSGKILWDKLSHAAVPRLKRHTKATHCNSTPAIADGTIFFRTTEHRLAVGSRE